MSGVTFHVSDVSFDERRGPIKTLNSMTEWMHVSQDWALIDVTGY